MKLSEVTQSNVVNYLKLNEGEYNEDDILMVMTGSKAFIKGKTGLTDDEVDLHEDITIVFYVLCKDMYDTRTYYVDTANLNRLVTTILNMHRKNFLAKPEVVT